MAYTPTATASAHPVVMTIQPAFWAFDRVRRTPATTPSPRMIRSPVPTISASMIWKPSVKVPMPRSLSVRVYSIPRFSAWRGESDRRRAPPSVLLGRLPRSHGSVGVVVLASREVAAMLVGMLVRRILLALGEVASPRLMDALVAGLLALGEVAEVLLLEGVALVLLPR